MPVEVLKYDQWLSGVIQKDTYTVSPGPQVFEALADTSSKEHAEWVSILKRRVFVYAKVSPDDIGKVKFLENSGFNLIDTNVTFSKPISEPALKPGSAVIADSTLVDEEQTVNLAKQSFIYSRFHLDPQFTKETADLVKGEWVRNYFHGKRGTAMIVAREGDTIIGFLQLLRSPEGITIDLIAVDNKHRGKQVAGAMIGYAENKFYGAAERITAGTQLANSTSIRLYQNLGFRLEGAKYVFHFHNQHTTKEP